MLQEAQRVGYLTCLTDERVMRAHNGSRITYVPGLIGRSSRTWQASRMIMMVGERVLRGILLSRSLRNTDEWKIDGRSESGRPVSVPKP